MAACSAFGCTNRFSKKIPGISFHRFPADIQLREKWIQALRRKDFKPSEYSRLCSAHFTEDSFDRYGDKIRLKQNAVPSIFEGFPSYYKNMVNLAVAHFFVLHEVEIINTNWLLNEKVCAWPPYKNSRLYKALLSAEQPTEDWKLYKIAILGYYDSYEKALQKCLKTKSTSDLEIEPSSEEKKTRKKRKRIILSDSEEEEEHRKLPHPTIVPNPPCLQEHVSQTESLFDMPAKVSNNFPQTQLSDAPTSVKKQMLITLLDIQRMLKEHTVLFNKLLIKEPKSSFSVEFLAHLPIKCMKELEELENILQNDEYFAKTVQFLGKRCEYDFKATTRSMLHFLLVDEVASKFNWAGRGEKLEFRKLRLKNVVVDAVKDNVNAGNVPIKLIEDTIKDWLKFAPSRILYRKSKEELM